MTTRRKILFATDYSESTDHVLTYAASLARDWGATLLVAHVSQLEQYPVGELFDEEPQPSPEELAELTAVTPPDPIIPCEHRLLYGDPAEEIVKLADEEQVETIVIGTHDHSRLLRLLGGSVAEKLLQTAHCPVITYRMSSRAAVAGGEGDVAPEGEVGCVCQVVQPSVGMRRKAAGADADLQRTVGEWTAHRPQVYGVFNKHGIDVVLEGEKRLAEVCREKGIDPRHLADEVAAALRPTYRETGTDWYQSSMTELCDHIEATHHDYLRRELPRLDELVAQSADRYRDEYPELEEVKAIFGRFRCQLLEHIETEGTVLFPALRRLDAAEMSQKENEVDPHGLILRMTDDHDYIRETLLQIRRLTNGYAPPRAASTAHRSMLGGLWEFEANLHLNVHEEEDILFSKALLH